MPCCTMRFGSTAKVLLKCKLKYYRISECAGSASAQATAGPKTASCCALVHAGLKQLAWDKALIKTPRHQSGSHLIGNEQSDQLYECRLAHLLGSPFGAPSRQWGSQDLLLQCQWQTEPFQIWPADAQQSSATNAGAQAGLISVYGNSARQSQRPSVRRRLYVQQLLTWSCGFPVDCFIRAPKAIQTLRALPAHMAMW